MAKGPAGQPIRADSGARLELDRNVDAIEGVGELWNGQDERPMDPMIFTAPHWLIIKGCLAVIVLTTIFLLYSLPELGYTLYGNLVGLVIFGAGPFFVGWSLGISFMKAGWALVYGLVIGLAATILALYLFYLPYSMEIWLDFGPGHSVRMWSNWLMTFFATISFVPIGAAVAASTNAYE